MVAFPNQRFLPGIFPSSVKAGLIFSAICLAAFAVIASGQDTGFSDRGNRSEGLVTTREISGDYFLFTGLKLVAGSTDLSDANELTLSFRLPEKETLVIKVWLPGKNYWMVPHQKEFGSGGHEFSWPADLVIKPLQVDANKLEVLICNETHTLFFPGQLHAGNPGDGEPNYVFSFKSRGGFFVNGAIVRETAEGFSVVREFERQENFPSDVRIVWDGLDSMGEPAEPGRYHLQLEGEIWLTDKDDELSINIPFVHAGVPN